MCSHSPTAPQQDCMYSKNSIQNSVCPRYKLGILYMNIPMDDVIM